ncbi:MAG: helix-turn-helix transcriptional regulator [Ruminococcus sp.]|nr:helix-turn-helix transcriptional regulator [Ruminococcus sp.]
MYFKRLRDLREDKDMNQTQVAEILNTKQTVYSRYERGFQTIPLEHLITLADFYGVSIDYITGRTNVKEVIQKNKDGRFIYKPFFK